MKDNIFQQIFTASSTAASVYRIVRQGNGECMIHLEECNAAFLKLFQCAGKEEAIAKQPLMISELKRRGLGDFVSDNRTHSSAGFRLYYKPLAKLLRFVLNRYDDTIICECFDLTRQFLQDECLDQFLNDQRTLLCITDETGFFLNINKEFTNILGYRQEELIGTTYFDLIHPEDIEKTEDALIVLRAGQRIRSFVNRIRHKDGTYRYIDWRSQPYDGIIFTSALDITDSVTMQKKLLEANEQLSKHSEEIEKANLYLEKISVTDMLTGVYNRRFINHKINEESKRMKRYKYPLSMIFFDLDHFKSVNDTYGHMIGDDILKVTCDIVEKHIRETDIFGRWGGEEFVIIAPHTNQQGAVELAEKLRDAVASYDHPLVGKVTCSFGVVEYNRKESIKEFYERADDALYRAKTDGRNRVITADEKRPVGSVYLVWDESLETGNQMIDRQHRSIMDHSNELIDQLLLGDDMDTIYDKMKQLTSLVSEHFSTEIAILEKIGFPDIYEHKQAHHKIEEKGEHLLIEFKNNRISPTAFFAFIVDDIMFGHLMEFDSKFFPYLKQSTSA